jgi:transposase
MAVRGKEFSREMVGFVVNLKHYFDAERKAGKSCSTTNPAGRTAAALGIGEATVKRIMSRYNRGGLDAVLSSGTGKAGRPISTSKNLQPVVREFIRSHNLKGTKVTIEGVRSMLIDKHSTEVPLATLWRCLQRWGFIRGEGKRRCALKEQDYVIQARRQYLREKLANRAKDGGTKRPEVYLDETYINKNHSNSFTWYLDEDGPWVNKPSGAGRRLIIVNAITEQGWVNGAELVFEAGKSTGDYHGQMNWENFSSWFTNQLLPNIPANSIIIMDNAKYHNVLVDNSSPNSSYTKEALKEWLDSQHIPWKEDMLKTELLALCKRFSEKPKFKLDELAEAAGHSILRTPPYHPELQPIETCWAIAKNFLADNCDFTMKNLRALLPDAFAKVTAKTCQGLIRNRVRTEEDRYWSEDERLDQLLFIEETMQMGRELPEWFYDNPPLSEVE